MPYFAYASTAYRETLRHLVYPKSEYLVPSNFSKFLRHRFLSTSTPHLRSSPAAKDSNTFTLENSGRVDDVHIPFHGVVTKAKHRRRYLPDSSWKHASSPSYSRPQIEPCDDSVPQFGEKRGTSQSYRLRSKNSIHRSSRDVVLRPRHKVSTAATGSRSEDHNSNPAFFDEKVAKESIDIKRTRRIHNLKFNIRSHGGTIRDSSRINQIQIFSRPPRSEYSVTSDIGMSLPKVPRESWQVQKKALFEKFGSSGWSPRKRLSPDALEGIRMLHSQSPDKYSTPALADHFQVSPEAIRRILKSKWRPNEEEEAKRRKRWDKRGESIWSQMVEIGIKAPKKWRDMGVGKTKARSAGTSLGHKQSIRHTLVAAIRPWDSESAIKDRRVLSSPIPLSERIL